MAVSCGEVMYGAYYPYLYGRGAARTFHHAPHFQYDRLNVQSGAAEGYGAAGAGGAGAGALSSGSASSGAHSPASPPHAHLAPHQRLRTKEEDLSAHDRHSNDGGGSSESEGECAAGAGAGAAGSGGTGGRRAQYVSANCVVFTHYAGDVAAVVDAHFSRALALDKHKESVPMVSRNLPASFFNALGGGATGGGAGVGAGCELYEYDPWQAHYGHYGHAHRHAEAYHAAAAHHNMAHPYGGLLLPRSMHPQYKPVEWPQHAPLDAAACPAYSYPPVHGLEAPAQDTSKDLYWF